MSYEEKVAQEGAPKKLDISFLKFFWQANPISGNREGVGGFLREVELFKGLSLGELKKLSRWFHFRHFEDKETIFKCGQVGIGFYLVYSGRVNLILDDESPCGLQAKSEIDGRQVLSLQKFDHFGEMALIQKNSLRNVSAVAYGDCDLLGIFKPDIEELMGVHPLIVTKISWAIAELIAERLFLLGEDYVSLKHKLEKVLESADR